MPRSIYSKVQVLLARCGDSPGIPTAELIQGVRDEQLDTFKVFRSHKGTVLEDLCQPQTIEATLELMHDLGLITKAKGCKLTTKGRNATKNYSPVLEQAILDHFDKPYGLAFVKVQQAIRRIRRRANQDVPTAALIYEDLKAQKSLTNPAMSRERFVTLMNLLGRCDGLVHSEIRKWYRVE